MNNIAEKIRELNFPKLESNRDPTTGDLVARMYQAGTSNKNYIVEPDGSHFTGKITSKKFYRKCKSDTGKYIVLQAMVVGLTMLAGSVTNQKNKKHLKI